MCKRAWDSCWHDLISEPVLLHAGPPGGVGLLKTLIQLIDDTVAVIVDAVANFFSTGIDVGVVVVAVIVGGEVVTVDVDLHFVLFQHLVVIGAKAWPDLVCLFLQCDHFLCEDTVVVDEAVAVVVHVVAQLECVGVNRGIPIVAVIVLWVCPLEVAESVVVDIEVAGIADAVEVQISLIWVVGPGAVVLIVGDAVVVLE